MRSRKFYHKSPILIYNVDINKIIDTSQVPFSKKDVKYFIGYKDDKKN